MKSFSIILTGNGDKFCLLTKNGLIPSAKIEAETGVKLRKSEVFSKNISGTKFYFTQNAQRPINGWKWIPLIALERLEENYGALLCEALGKFWEVMPSFNKKLENIKLPPIFKKKEFSGEVIFFSRKF